MRTLFSLCLVRCNSILKNISPFVVWKRSHSTPIDQCGCWFARHRLQCLPVPFHPVPRRLKFSGLQPFEKIHDLIFGLYCQENMWNSTTTNVVLFHFRQMNCFELWQRNRRFLSVFSARSAFCFGFQTRLSEIVSHQPFSNGQFLKISCGQ